MVITLAVQTEAPKIKPPKSTEIAAYLGKGFSLDCLASGKPPAQISWILPDKTFVRDMGTVHTRLSPMSLLQNGTLQIISANFSNKGDYKCIASNAAGADTITYHLHVAALPPSISEDAVDQVIAPPGVFYLFKPSAVFFIQQLCGLMQLCLTRQKRSSPLFCERRTDANSEVDAPVRGQR